MIIQILLNYRKLHRSHSNAAYTACSMLLDRVTVMPEHSKSKNFEWDVARIGWDLLIKKIHNAEKRDRRDELLGHLRDIGILLLGCVLELVTRLQNSVRYQVARLGISK